MTALARRLLVLLLVVASAVSLVVVPGVIRADAAAPYYDSTRREGSLYRLYRAYFLREPDHHGFAYWYLANLTGTHISQVSAHFAASAEFAERYGKLDDGAFVDVVYRNVLGRSGDAAGRHYWRGRMRDGMTRGAVVLMFSDAREYRVATATDLPPGYRAGSNALAILSELAVTAEGPRVGFEAGLFPGWDDADGNGCNTECERFAVERRSDGTWFSVWDGKLTADRSELRLDHVVSPAEAWDSGASTWTAGQRRDFANWATNLVITSSATDLAKGDGDAGDWYPPRPASNCVLAETVVATKRHWNLTVDPAEVTALTKMLAGCTPTTSDAPPVPEPQPEQVITYAVESRGTIGADLETFAAYAAETLADPRGWSMGGTIRYERVAAGGDFTLVLSQASRLPSFGPPCDVNWSCRSGRHVIINETRWLGASSSWTLGLRNYQHYVVIHELGHWLGEGHASCPRSGAPAPVMMQQSINRGTCTNNVWPLDGERRRVAARRGVSIRP